MGNDNQLRVNEKYYKTCHPGLVQYEYDKQLHLLYSQLKVQQTFIIWRKLVDPLLSAKHIFIPAKIVAPQHFTSYGCCTQEDFHRVDMQNKIIYYHPFVYTFDKEILDRKDKKVLFQQQQLWKIIGYLSKALIEWKKFYPLEKIGSVCPFNIIMNEKGQVKLVCRLSFFNNQFNQSSLIYSPPESRQNSIIKYSLNPNRDPNGIEASEIYGIGIVILQALTLQLSGVSVLQTPEKQTLMQKSNNYSHQLKDFISSMISHNQASRPKVSQLYQRAKFNRTRHL